MSDPLVEQLSSQVHDAWWEEKKKQGFHAPLECPIINRGWQKYHKDKFEKLCDKCHTDMYPYAELPENIKEYDRVTVRTVLNALTSLGYTLLHALPREVPHA